VKRARSREVKEGIEGERREMIEESRGGVTVHLPSSNIEKG